MLKFKKNKNPDPNAYPNHREEEEIY